MVTDQDELAWYKSEFFIEEGNDYLKSYEASTLGLKTDSVLTVIIEVKPKDATFYLWSRSHEFHI